MAQYHEGELEVQRRAGVALNAERIGRSIHATIPPLARQFALERPFVVVGAGDADGRVWASLLRGAPGFLTVPAEDRLHIAARLDDDDPLAEALAGEAEVGLLLIDPATRRRMRVNGHARPDGAAGLEITTREVYANCPKYIRPREVALPAAATPPVRVGSSLDSGQMRRLAEADTLFLASRHPAAGADVSHRGGAPGFVHVTAPDRLVIPDYSGNMMFTTLGNLAADPRAGLLLVDFEHGGTLQLSGRARIEWDRSAVAAYEGAERLVELTVDGVVEREGGGGVSRSSADTLPPVR
jgi:predicted pyridoxine 5'-phosphate oxidase superfamily flavin-nucleotide-binding protein